MPHGFGLAQSTITIGNTNIEAAAVGDNGSVLVAQQMALSQTLSSETKCNTSADLIIGTVDQDLSITVVIFCWHILLISESMDHHDSEIMDDRSID